MPPAKIRRWFCKLSRLAVELFRQPFEHCRMVFGEFGENLAVEGDVGFLECADEFGIREPERAHGGIDAECPKIAKFAFLCAAVTERMCAGMADRFLGNPLLARTIETIAFGLGQNILAPLILLYTPFYSRHKLLVVS